MSKIFKIVRWNTMNATGPSGFPADWNDNTGLFGISRVNSMSNKDKAAKRVAEKQGAELVNFTVTNVDTDKVTSHVCMSDQFKFFVGDQLPVTLDNEGNATFDLSGKDIYCTVGKNKLEFSQTAQTEAPLTEDELNNLTVAELKAKYPHIKADRKAAIIEEILQPA